MLRELTLFLASCDTKYQCSESSNLILYLQVQSQLIRAHLLKTTIQCVHYKDMAYRNTNSPQRLSHDLHGDSQWQKLNLPLAGSHPKSKEIILCSHIFINVHDKENHNMFLNISNWYSTLTVLHLTDAEI